MAPFEYLGPYKLGEMLGRGGMGSVYAAVHAKSGDKVAVKVIEQSVADDMRFRVRFTGEIETLKRLHHKSIVRIIGTGEEDDLLFYVMELVDGESLQSRLRREKRLSWQATIDIAIQVCSALKHAHDIGAFHRDLKPANLILTNDATVKLVDFGIAKLFGFGEPTVAGSILGTADYMAPEQADGRPTTPRTDLYSLGSVMYAMLAGRPPFTGKRLTDVIQSLKRDRPVPLDLICPDVPEALVELVHELLEKDPDDRPPTALAVMKRLQAMRAGLQREMTLNQDAQPTKLGKAPEEFDRRPGDDPDDRDSAFGSLTGLTSEGHTASDKPGTIATDDRSMTNRATPDDLTIESLSTRARHSTNVAPNAATSPGTKAGKTHYQALEPPRKSESAFASQHHEHSSNWINYLSVAGMIAILAGGVALFAWSVRTPSADQMYDQLLAADRDGDTLAEQALIKQFVNHYPDDRRLDTVMELSAAVELEQHLRRLRTKANRAGGTEQLDPAEQAFMDAMALRGRRPSLAIEQLQQWINVFGHESAATGYSIRVMKNFVDEEVKRLRSSQEQTVKMDSRVEDLRNRILWGKDNLNQADQRALLEGIIELYRRKTWADSAVQLAQRELAALANQ